MPRQHDGMSHEPSGNGGDQLTLYSKAEKGQNGFHKNTGEQAGAERVSTASSPNQQQCPHG